MPTHPVWSLKTPWWALWGLERLKNESPFGRAMRKLWMEKFEAICAQRGCDYTYVARRAGMTYKQLFERRSGQTYENSSPPMHELYLLANALNVEVVELIPTCRELFTLATTCLIDDYHQSNPDAPRFKLSRAAPSAYAEYFCAEPNPKVRGVLDSAAAERAYQALGGRLNSVEETEEALITIGGAIDEICSSLRGEPI